MTETAYQPKFIWGSRILDRDEAIRFIVDGHRVVVAVPDEDRAGMGDLRITIAVGNWNWNNGDACTAGEFNARLRALAAGDLEVYAAVMAAAASLMGDADRALLERDLAGA